MSLIFILILAIPSFFISKWSLKKLDIGTSKNRKYIALFPTFNLSPLFYIAFILIWMASSSYYPTHEFNKLQWEANSEERYTMSQNLIESEMLIGKSKSEVSDVLGSDFYVYNENHISYNLGFLPGLFNIDPDVLDIYFKYGKVVRVSQHES
ncbi:conserved hypothetical protein [Formosa agariphila KMM 3901]|uniref:Uncharacterized protein n=1 Tax=Formosa agariphila (strain DSM 15362 / KCTC 12365 / LMG 23005 / KMM 3901 / M-2Alg 35-1) TaxID=1347342 RepID=T2KJK3_FORAG|nr:hypothetical protein [Formosa agariphila]CDF78613.1 conserved hypothetical protein [Formosa agariphila KMM 3901]